MLGIAMFLYAGLNYATTTAKASSIVCQISHLRGEHIPEDVETVEHKVSTTLNEIKGAFKPLMAIGGVTFAVGFVGLVAEIIRRRREGVQPANAAYRR